MYIPKCFHEQVRKEYLIKRLKEMYKKDNKETQAEQLPQDAVMRRFLMEFILNNRVEQEEVECEDWSKAKHFIQRKYKLQDEPRVIREVKTYA